MKKLGKKQLTLHLQQPMCGDPGGAGRLVAGLEGWRGAEIEYRFDSVEQDTGVPALLKTV